MKKLFQKGLSLVLIGMMVMSVAACGKKTAIEGEQALEVYVWDAGYGTEWCSALLKAFSEQDWVKEKYPNLKYDLVTNDQNAYAEGRITAGSINSIDLFFASSLSGVYETDALELTDLLYESVVPGEDILYKEKMRPYMYEALAYSDGDTVKYYSTTWSAGVIGFIYNKTLFEELGLSLPRTTEEMYELCETVKSWEGSNALYPYTTSIISSKIAYSDRLMDVWWAQYDGLDGFQNYWNAIAPDGTRNSVDIFKEQGRLKSVEVYETLYKETNGYYDRTSINYDFIQGQTRMYTGEGLMMVCGEWFANEMRDLANEYQERGYDYEIGMMRVPVVSDLIEQTPTILNDEMLRQVITDVDEGRTTATDDRVSAEDFQRVYEARKLFKATDSVNANAVIPKYAEGKDVAVDFLRYMATDEANGIYAEHTSGGLLPFQYEIKTDDPDLHRKLQEQYGKTYTVLSDTSDIITADDMKIIYANSDMQKYGGFRSIIAKYSNLEVSFMSTSTLTSAQVIQESDAYWLENNATRFHSALSQAGLK